MYSEVKGLEGVKLAVTHGIRGTSVVVHVY